jgi:NADPH:quinone reductase-like Zn-dependent oxidoreductase
MEDVLQVSHMRAVVLKGVGSVDVMQFVSDRAVPTIKKDEVLIRVRACALSETDVEVREGRMLIPYESTTPNELGIIIGYEVSGEIYRMGKEVQDGKMFKIGDEVVGIVPLDSPRGGNAEFTVLHHLSIVAKPAKVPHNQAAAALLSGLRAYTAMNYHMKLLAGETILICDGASADGYVAIQLALSWGAKVFVTVATPEQADFVKLNCPQVTKIILTTGNWVTELLSETGGLGADMILDNLKSRYRQGYTKSELIRCLAVHGRWTTTSSDIQLDPPESKILYMKNATISYLFEHSWILANAQQGRYLHILKEVLEKLEHNQLKVKLTVDFPLERLKDAHLLLQTANTNGGKIVLQM